MVGTQRFRARKLDVKRPMPIYLASDLPNLDLEDVNRSLDIETGVEKEEEAEHHLQAAISATQAAITGQKSLSSTPQSSTSSQPDNKSSAPSDQQLPTVHIPTPDTRKDLSLKSRWYSKKISTPKSKIHTIITIEDSCGPMYCMDEEDEKWLLHYNSNLQLQISSLSNSLKSSTSNAAKLESLKSQIVSEKQFEVYMDQLESIYPLLPPQPPATPSPASSSFPNSNIPPFQDLIVDAFNKGIHIDPKAQYIFDYYKSKKSSLNFVPLMPTLATLDPEKTSSNPYICFRKREVKQARKTRRADVKILETLQNIQLNLVYASQLLETVCTREKRKKEILDSAKKASEKRTLLLALKRHYSLPTPNISELFFAPHKSVSHSVTKKRPLQKSSGESSLASPSGVAFDPNLLTPRNLVPGSAEHLKAAALGLAPFPGSDALSSLSQSLLTPSKSHGVPTDLLSLKQSSTKQPCSKIDVPIYSTPKNIRELTDMLKHASKTKLDSMRSLTNFNRIPAQMNFIFKHKKYLHGKNYKNLFKQEFCNKIAQPNLLSGLKANLGFGLRRGRLGRLYLDQSIVLQSKDNPPFNNPQMGSQFQPKASPSFSELDLIKYKSLLLDRFKQSSSQGTKPEHPPATQDSIISNSTPNPPPQLSQTFATRNFFGVSKNPPKVWKNSSEYMSIFKAQASIVNITPDQETPDTNSALLNNSNSSDSLLEDLDFYTTVVISLSDTKKQPAGLFQTSKLNSLSSKAFLESQSNSNLLQRSLTTPTAQQAQLSETPAANFLSNHLSTPNNQPLLNTNSQPVLLMKQGKFSKAEYEQLLQRYHIQRQKLILIQHQLANEIAPGVRPTSSLPPSSNTQPALENKINTNDPASFSNVSNVSALPATNFLVSGQSLDNNLKPQVPVQTIEYILPRLSKGVSLSSETDTDSEIGASHIHPAISTTNMNGMLKLVPPLPKKNVVIGSKKNINIDDSVDAQQTSPNGDLDDDDQQVTNTPPETTPLSSTKHNHSNLKPLSKTKNPIQYSYKSKKRLESEPITNQIDAKNSA
ncbi:hypothetical protein BB560_006328, partial [Smittium megazygosporum]